MSHLKSLLIVLFIAVTPTELFLLCGDNKFHYVFILQQLFSWHHFSRELRAQLDHKSFATNKLIPNLETFKTVFITRVKPSNHSHGLRLTSGFIAINHTDLTRTVSPHIYNFSLNATLHVTNRCVHYDNQAIDLMSRVFANGPGDLGSIPACVIPKTLKMVLDITLFKTQKYKVRIKGKVEQSRERSSALPYTLV